MDGGQVKTTHELVELTCGCDLSCTEDREFVQLSLCPLHRLPWLAFPDHVMSFVEPVSGELLGLRFHYEPGYSNGVPPEGTYMEEKDA